MFNLERIIQIIQTDLPGLQGIYLFGSYAGGYATEKSDIDIAVLCQSHISPDVKKNMLNTFFDYTNKVVDFIELRYANTIFQEEIIKTAQRVLTVDEEACERFEDYVYCSAMDFRVFRQPQVDEIIARGNVYG